MSSKKNALIGFQKMNFNILFSACENLPIDISKEKEAIKKIQKEKKEIIDNKGMLPSYDSIRFDKFYFGDDGESGIMRSILDKIESCED